MLSFSLCLKVSFFYDKIDRDFEKKENLFKFEDFNSFQQEISDMFFLLYYYVIADRLSSKLLNLQANFYLA